MSTSSTIKINVTSPRTTKTTRPVWGVLTQPTDSEERLVDFEERYREYVPASFVRWLESGGARVIPIQYVAHTAHTTAHACDFLKLTLTNSWLPRSATTQKSKSCDICSRASTAFFSPAARSPTSRTFSTACVLCVLRVSQFWSCVSHRNTPYGHTAKLLFRWAKEANDAGDHFPIYGTCQGFQLMCQLAANNFTLKQRVKGCVGVSKPLEFTHKAKSSRLFGSLPQHVYRTLAETPCGEHMHNYCITPETFEGTTRHS